MEELYHFVIRSNILVCIVAVTSFVFSAINPANSTHLLLVVDEVCTLAFVGILIGGLCALAELFTHFLAWLRREDTNNNISSRISAFRSILTLADGSKKTDLGSFEEAKEPAANAQDAAKPCANAEDTAKPCANDASNEEPAKTEEANGAGLECAEKSTKDACKEEPSECHSACSSQGTSDTSDAVSGASTI
jgi:uncharacterized membrane protein